MWKLSGVLPAGIAIAAIGLYPHPLRAQDSSANDPPGRAARLAWIEGNVSFQPGGVEDWVPATLNRPLTTGDRLWTDAGARTELNLGSAAFRLSGRTNFTFLNLTDLAVQGQLSSGTLSVRVRNLADQEIIEIDTPQAAYSLLAPGEYRIDVNERGDATIATVRGGEAEVASGEQTFRIRAREQVRVTEENGRPVFDRRPVPVADAFDNWCQDRDRREDRSESARHMSRDIPGYADLDDHGVWREEQQYAWIWMPRVPPGWAPYRYGHWAWIEPWGWTWVDDAPWGYAPFHYGRWVFVGDAWGWVPGPMVVRPVFCPALVAWVGGPHFGIGISIGGPPVGWFPLGPREVWVPPYRHSPRYIERVNVTNTVIVNRTVINNNINVNYVNRRVPGAVTAVPRDVLTSGRPVGSAGVRVPPDIAARGDVGTFAPVAPQRGAVLDGRAPGGPAPPPAVINRRFVARETPPAPPVPFTQRQPALQADPGRPLDRATNNQIQRSQPPLPRPSYRQATPQARPTPAPATGGAQPPPAVSRPAPQPGVEIPRQQGIGQERRGAPPIAQPQGGAQVPRPQPQARPEYSPPARPRPQAQQPQVQSAPQPPPVRPQVQRVPQQPPPQPQVQRPPQAPRQPPQIQRQPQPEAGRPGPAVRPGGAPRGNPPAREQRQPESQSK